MHKGAAVFLMLREVVSKANDDCSIESAGLAVRLRAIRCCCEVFSSKEGTHCSKMLADKLSTIFCKYVR